VKERRKRRKKKVISNIYKAVEVLQKVRNEEPLFTLYFQLQLFFFYMYFYGCKILKHSFKTFKIITPTCNTKNKLM